MHRILLLGLTGALALATVGGAYADSLGQCRSNADPRARLAACTAAIADANVSASEKATALRIRGSARLEAGARDQALEDLTNSIALEPTEQAYVLRAQARLSDSDTASAIADFDAALKRNPRSIAALTGRGHANLVKGDAAAAIRDFSDAILINPKSVIALNNRGLAYRKAGDEVKALADFTMAIGVNPVYALAYNNRGYAYEAQGRLPEALADFRRALLLDPSLTGAKEGLARVSKGTEVAEESIRLIGEGRSLVEAHCARCHAVGGAGESQNPKAPAFRALHGRHPNLALREPLARGIAAPHDEMPRFKLADADVDKIVAYINSLATGR